MNTKASEWTRNETFRIFWVWNKRPLKSIFLTPEDLKASNGVRAMAAIISLNNHTYDCICILYLDKKLLLLM